MMFINETGIFGKIFEASINNVSGNPVISLFIALLILLFICILMRIPFEWGLVLTLPFTLLLMSFSSSFLLIGGLVLFYLAIIFTKNFFFN